MINSSTFCTDTTANFAYAVNIQQVIERSRRKSEILQAKGAQSKQSDALRQEIVEKDTRIAELQRCLAAAETDARNHFMDAQRYCDNLAKKNHDLKAQSQSKFLKPSTS